MQEITRQDIQELLCNVLNHHAKNDGFEGVSDVLAALMINHNCDRKEVYNALIHTLL